MPAKAVKNQSIQRNHTNKLSQQTMILAKTPEYTMVRVIGSGTFGSVFEARTSTGNIVAIKKVVQDPRFKNRELEILQKLNHPNCLKLYQSFFTKEGNPPQVFLHIVTDLFPMDLSQFMKTVSQPIPSLTKVFSYQLFRAIAYIHSLHVCHRDIKPRNVLINPTTGNLQLCDFGSAKPILSNEQSVSYIATRSYRAPELLFGCTSYGPSVDVWASGCVISEMLLRGQTLFNGNSNDEMITAITNIIGSPTVEEVADMRGDKIYLGPIKRKLPLCKHLPRGSDPLLVDLLEQIFVFSPSNRITSSQCLMHKYFDEVRAGSVILPNGTQFVLPEEHSV